MAVMARLCLVAVLTASIATKAWGCEGALHGSGTFTSLGYPSQYPAMTSCTWVLTAEPGMIPFLSFSSFELEAGTDCLHDYVKVYSGPSDNSDLIRTFCGATVPGVATTHKSVMTVQFKSDRSHNNTGFLAAFTSVPAETKFDLSISKQKFSYARSCGGRFMSESGAITSPGYSMLFPNSASCSYLIGVPAGRVVLTFLEINVEPSSSCNVDYIEVRDGGTNGTLLNTLCYNALPGKIVASGQFLHLQFVSNSNVQKTGVLAKWEELTCEMNGGECESSCDSGGDSSLPCSNAGTVCCFPKIQAGGCGGALSGSGTFTSPGYPSNYPASTSCSWVITAESGKVVSLSFSAFELEAGTDCPYDYVKVYSGPSSASTLIGTFCGVSVPAAITSSSNVITVEFMSDSSLSYKGISAAFQSVAAGSVPTTPIHAGSCGGDFTSETGTIASPNHPNLYPNLASCSYLIGVPAGRTVLTFLTVDVETSPGCMYDRVEVRDGSGNGELLKTLCGNALPGKIIASGRFLHVQFVSDSSIQKTGFQAKWEVLTCETDGGRCVNECEGRTDSTLPCSDGGAVCCLPKIQTGVCGQPVAEKIIGGNYSAPHAWPWQCSLQQQIGFHICGCSIISERFVITAAHCVDGFTTSSLRVVVGAYNLKQPNHDPNSLRDEIYGQHHFKQANQEQILQLASYVKHEHYGNISDGFPNDIAIIHLATPMELNRYVMPICLPEPMEECADEEDQYCFITGWGKTNGTDSNILNELRIKVITRADCRLKWGANYINDGQCCVGNGLTGACNGDSGGPLVCLRTFNGRPMWVLVGAASWGRTTCMTEGYPSVYTRVSYFMDWIETKIRATLNGQY